ncbi:hypothetical protein [Agromyces sp. NPDC058064]|uniref:hypothetical protein n=1 Tax=Agromyces sp. NPDC058064 TaxID=3346322 RepID=UPI0036D822F3
MTNESEPYDDATTGQKSHRYLRLSLVLIVVALLLSVTYQSISSGVLLNSISHYFYTPAHAVFVGSLIAASLALVALSGRDSDPLNGYNIEPVLLDIAAVFAPLIAIVPTGIVSSELMTLKGSNSELLATYGVTKAEDLEMLKGWCGGPKDDCVPSVYQPSIHVSLWTYIIIVLIIVALILWIRREKLWDRKHRQTRRDESPQERRRRLTETLLPPAIALATALGFAYLAFGPDSAEFPFNFPIIGSSHYAVTILFFGTFAAVPAVNYLRYRRQPPNPDDQDPFVKRIRPGLGRFYLSIPILMLVDLGLLFVLGVGMKAFPWVFIGEAGALLLFATFWAVQTVHRWDDPNALYVAGQASTATETLEETDA